MTKDDLTKPKQRGMGCEVCGKEVDKERNWVVCSDKCAAVRLKIYKLTDKYFPCHGCDNCWSDSHSGCTEECIKEFRDMGEFSRDLWSIIKIIYPREDTK